MRLPVPVGIALAALATTGSAQQILYEGGLSGSTGTYFFADRTTSFAFSNGIQLRAGRWSIRASIPAWLQNTTLLTSSGPGPVPTGGPGGREAVRDSGQARQSRQHGSGGNQNGQGRRPASQLSVAPATDAVVVPPEAVTGYEVSLADPMLSGSVRLVSGRRLGLTLGAAVKVPLADTAGLGTGQWDAGASLSASLRLGPRWTLGLDAAWWSLGDLDSLPLRDPVLGSLSAGLLLGDRWAAMLALAASTTTLTGYDPPATLSLAFSRVGMAASWGGSLGVGLTESSPEVMAGLSWSIPLRGRRE